MTVYSAVALSSGRASLPGFWYDGEITDLSYSGPLDLFIDNEAVDPDSLVDPDEPGPFRPTGLPQRITIDGTNSGTSSYSITVSDQIKSVSIPDGDTIDGTTAAGSVEGDADVYDFSGSITQLQLEGRRRPKCERLSTQTGSGSIEAATATGALLT